MNMNDKIFQSNISILKSKAPEIAEKITLAKGTHVSLVSCKNGSYSISVSSDNGRNLFIHSKIDPLKEAERFVADIDPANRDLIIILGFGLGYHIREILKKHDGISKILIIEKDPLIIQKAFEVYNFDDILKIKELQILCDPSEDSILSFLKGKASANILFVMHRGSHQIYPDYYNNILSLLKSYISTKDVNIATLAKFEKLWCSNIARNLPFFINSPGAKIFYNKFDGVPAIIAAAGPSLSDSLKFIKENSKKALIIAVDTSYRILINHGITPHFCISVDPQVINARYFEGTDNTETVLVADPMVHPSVFRFFKGKTTVTSIAFEMMKWIENSSGDKGEMCHGGSVSTNAYDFAKRLGAYPIILAGQDLAFTKGLAHAKGSYLDEQIHNKTNRISNAEMFNRRQLTFLPKIFLPGINGKAIHTNQKMIIFIKWFESRKDPEIINASRDGVLLNGIKHIHDSDIELNTPAFDIKSKIDEILDSSNLIKKELTDEFMQKISTMLFEVEELIPSLKRAINLSMELSQMIEKGTDKQDPGKVKYIIKRLDEIDRFIESKKDSKDMISFSIQRVIHTITEGYHIDGEEANSAKKSEFLYRGLLEGALFNKKILLKMQKALKSL